MNVCVKIGGSLAVNEELLEDFCKAVAQLQDSRVELTIVHGGGKDINENLSLLQESPQFINGLRVTDANVLKMVEMTLSGYVNKKIVRLIQKHGGDAVGISGCDGQLIVAQKTPNEGGVDLGFVGQAEKVNPHLAQVLMSKGYVPVVSPISSSLDGQAWNLNADTAAAAVAESLQVQKLIFISDVAGVLKNGEVISQLDENKISALIAEGVIQGGMIPKVKSCLDSIAAGISEVHICGWVNAETFVAQVLEGKQYGTIIS
jgi:acetylglutamate kinase